MRLPLTGNCGPVRTASTPMSTRIALGLPVTSPGASSTCPAVGRVMLAACRRPASRSRHRRRWFPGSPSHIGSLRLPGVLPLGGPDTVRHERQRHHDAQGQRNDDRHDDKDQLRSVHGRTTGIHGRDSGLPSHPGQTGVRSLALVSSALALGRGPRCRVQPGRSGGRPDADRKATVQSD
jgi:hypothetical protein